LSSSLPLSEEASEQTEKQFKTQKNFLAWTLGQEATPETV